MDDIPGALARLTEPFTTAEALEVGLNAWALRHLLRYQQIERLQRGRYRRVRQSPRGPHWAEVRAEHLARARMALTVQPRTLRPPNGVAVADSALRAGSTTRDEVAVVVRSQRRWIGRQRAEDALRPVDPRRENWLESYSFVTLHELGVELPTPQVEVFDAAGRFVGRVDGMWIGRGVVAEADGETKYLMDGAGTVRHDPEAAAHHVVAEGRRERDVERTGLVVVRWCPPEIRHQDLLVGERVRESWHRGGLVSGREGGAAVVRRAGGRSPRGTGSPRRPRRCRPRWPPGWHRCRGSR